MTDNNTSLPDEFAEQLPAILEDALYQLRSLLMRRLKEELRRSGYWGAVDRNGLTAIRLSLGGRPNGQGGIFGLEFSVNGHRLQLTVTTPDCGNPDADPPAAASSLRLIA